MLLFIITKLKFTSSDGLLDKVKRIYEYLGMI